MACYTMLRSVGPGLCSAYRRGQGVGPADGCHGDAAPLIRSGWSVAPQLQLRLASRQGRGAHRPILPGLHAPQALRPQDSQARGGCRLNGAGDGAVAYLTARVTDHAADRVSQ